MARIVIGSWMVRYPLGAVLSWNLQHLLGYQALGHEVWFVEKAGYPDSCFDPTRDAMSDDSAYGTGVVDRLLRGYGLGDRWCYVDANNNYHGVARSSIEEVFRTADLFVDMGAHGSWADESLGAGVRVRIDGEPGLSQIKMEHAIERGEPLPEYDRHYTVGMNLGTPASDAPTAGKSWGHMFDPVDTERFAVVPPPVDAPVTSIMNWQSHEEVVFQGLRYGQKDIEFQKFLSLPELVDTRLELGVAGKAAPRDELRRRGWALRDPHLITMSYESFCNYVVASQAEFAVCKNAFVALNTGWFSDRSAVYLASGRPVVMEETGYSQHLPTGEGLFAVRTVEEAADALRAITTDYPLHSRRAREIACEHLDSRHVLSAFLTEVGV